MRIFVFCLLCLVLLVGACGESAKEAAMEKKIKEATGSDADVDLSKEGVKITGETEEGEFALTTGEETEIPDDFPDDVFLYSPSKTMMAMKVPDGHSVSLITKDDKTKVVDAYKREMGAKGWTEEAVMSMGKNMMFTYKKDGRITGINFAPNDEGLQIIVTTGKE
ncbi:MAG: hypothetical protein ABIJ00_04800 [Candidatus Eisenbacteria bacterium]